MMMKGTSTVLAALLVALLLTLSVVVPPAAATGASAPPGLPDQVRVVDGGQGDGNFFDYGEDSTWEAMTADDVEVGDVLDIVWEPGLCLNLDWCPFWLTSSGDAEEISGLLSYVVPHGPGYPAYARPMTNTAHPWLMAEPRGGSAAVEALSRVWVSESVVNGYRQVGVGVLGGWMRDEDLATEEEIASWYADESAEDEADPDETVDQVDGSEVPADGADPAVAPQAPRGSLWEAWLALAVLAAVIVAVVTRAKRRREDDEPEPSDE